MHGMPTENQQDGDRAQPIEFGKRVRATLHAEIGEQSAGLGQRPMQDLGRHRRLSHLA
jgi:hypothetical protein